tara:strand:+ start:2384 stop:2812 length:429 start_codon:yes stop_codon:yes gene_type:complete
MLFNIPRYKRLLWISSLFFISTVTVYAVIKAFEENLVFFYTATQILDGEAPDDRAIRLGGMVKVGSLKRKVDTLDIEFKVIDENNNVIPVTYKGVVPDLFKEGKGVVAQGMIVNGVFKSTEILAKHDEDYMPPKLGIVNDNY